MPRPPKSRRVGFVPGVTYFKPAGVPLASLAEIQLSLEETEALRLKDLESLEQEEAAQKMNVSRATFQRILAAARKKVADALLNGKAVRIVAGNVEMGFIRFHCGRGHQWDKPDDSSPDVDAQVCPSCRQPGERMDITLPARGRQRGCKKRTE